MYENAFSRRHEQEPSISRTFIRLNVWQVVCEQRVAVVSRITNNCVEQSVIVIISVVSTKCELSKYLL